MKKQPDVSIIIGTYNTKNLVKKTLASIYRNAKNISVEIILIDDASEDGTYDMLINNYPDAVIIRNTKNLGYSKTYNKGTKLAKGRYILHINSDVQFTKDSHLDSIIKFMDENKTAGIVGCKVLKHNGKLDLPCRHAIPTLKNVLFQMFNLYRLFPMIRSTNYYMTYLNENQITEVGGILGAFMLIRRRVFKNIGFLDENFYLYCEDTDFCYRAIRAGWKVFYFPKITVKHIHGGTTRQFKMRALLMFHKGIYYYYKKHHSKNNSIILNYFVYLGITARLALFLSWDVLLSFYYLKNFKKFI